LILGMAAVAAGFGWAQVYGPAVPASSSFVGTPPIDVPPALAADDTIGYR
jgi:hypothetical protein